MLDAKLNIFAVISVESDSLGKLKYEEIIQDFTTIKNRHKQIGQ